jgi:hypothetical protein
LAVRALDGRFEDEMGELVYEIFRFKADKLTRAFLDVRPNSLLEPEEVG